MEDQLPFVRDQRIPSIEATLKGCVFFVRDQRIPSIEATLKGCVFFRGCERLVCSFDRDAHFLLVTSRPAAQYTRAGWAQRIPFFVFKRDLKVVSL